MWCGCQGVPARPSAMYGPTISKSTSTMNAANVASIDQSATASAIQQTWETPIVTM